MLNAAGTPKTEGAAEAEGIELEKLNHKAIITKNFHAFILCLVNNML